MHAKRRSASMHHAAFQEPFTRECPPHRRTTAGMCDQFLRRVSVRPAGGDGPWAARRSRSNGDDRQTLQPGSGMRAAKAAHVARGQLSCCEGRSCDTSPMVAAARRPLRRTEAPITSPGCRRAPIALKCPLSNLILAGRWVLHRPAMTRAGARRAAQGHRASADVLSDNTQTCSRGGKALALKLWLLPPHRCRPPDMVNVHHDATGRAKCTSKRSARADAMRRPAEGGKGRRRSGGGSPTKTTKGEKQRDRNRQNEDEKESGGRRQEE